MAHGGFVVGPLEVILQRRGSAFHGGELHAYAEEPPFDDRVSERWNVLPEEVLDLVIPVELPAHLTERIDLEHHGFGARPSFPAIGQEQERTAEAAGQRPKPSARPVHADELYDAQGLGGQLVPGFSRSDFAGAGIRDA